MDRGKDIVEELKKAGIHYIVWLPCSEGHFLYDAILSDPEIKAIQVCREAEAIAICAGLHVGGKRGAVLAVINGVYEAGNILNWAVDMEMPMLLLVGYAGYSRTKYPRLPASQSYPRRRPKKNFAEPYLDAFGIPRYLLDSDEDVKKVAPACEEAWNTHQPVALLITRADGYMAGT
ncbi:MAG: thiamine pyrophosphate-binding protein [Dehalococcoidia bacterium]|nr:thiamine pyrophosphate-binding protein [Dehalococcoidia bacterium]